MKVSDIMTRPVVACSREESVSKVLSLMRTRKIHQLVVMEKKQLLGMITLDRIIKRDAGQAAKVEGLMVPCPAVSPNAEIEEVAELMLGSNMRALPVQDRGLVGIVSETDLVKAAKVNASVRDVMQEAVCVGEEDSVGKVKEIMARENLSRVPVVSGGRCVGIVGTMELVPLLEARERSDARAGAMRDRGYKEPINVDQTSVKVVMRAPKIVQPDISVSEVLSLLHKHEEVVVENGSLGVITPKDVLRLLARPKKLGYLQITGLKDESSLDVYKVHQVASVALRRISAVTEVQPLKIILERTHKQGRKEWYEVRAQLPTQLGTFVSTNAQGWDFASVAQDAMDNLEREFWKKYDQRKQHKAGKKSKMMRRMR